MVLRVSDRATFVALRRASRRARRGPVTVAFTQMGGTRKASVAYAVPGSVGSATVRNRIRRRLRAAIAEMSDDLSPGAYMVSAGREVAELPFPELKGALNRAVVAASGTRDQLEQ